MKTVLLLIILLSVTLLGSACDRFLPAPSPTLIPTAPINSIDLILTDMTQPHAGSPHGVPETYNWFTGPRVGMGNQPGTFKAVIAWGQLYEDAKGNPAANTRVQIRDIRAYALLKSDGKWHQIQHSTAADGAAYVEDFAGNKSKPAEIRKEADGSISVKAGNGYNFHFWPTTGRTEIIPKDISAIFTTVQARLIVEDPSRPDDRAQARYLLSMGGDYWADMNAKWDNFKTNGDIGVGRFKYVTSEWQSFNMITTLTDAVRQNPPPIE